MLNKLLIILILLLTLFLSGCGKTNLLEWTKPAGSTSSTLDQARTYIDYAEYSKAKSLLDSYLKDKPNDSEANILYGQAQLGLANIDLASIINALAEETPTPSLCKLNTICAPSNRGKVYDAAQRFISYPPTDPSDKVISAFCGMIAYTAIIHDTFDNANNTLLIDSIPGGELDPGAPANGRWTTMASQSPNHNNYLALATDSFASLSGDQDIQDAISSMNVTMQFIDINIGGLTWGNVKSLLLSF